MNVAGIANREATGRNEAAHVLGDGFVHSVWGQEQYLAAPLELPVGTEIRRLSASLSNAYDSPVSFQLRRKRLNNTVPSELIAEVHSTPLDGTVQTAADTDIQAPIVDPAYHDFLVAHYMDGTPDQRICDVSVEHSGRVLADDFDNGNLNAWDNPDVPTGA